MDYITVVSSLIKTGESLLSKSGDGSHTGQTDYDNYRPWRTRVLRFVGKLKDDDLKENYEHKCNYPDYNAYPKRHLKGILALLYSTKEQINNGEIIVERLMPQTTNFVRKKYDVFLSHANKDKIAYVDLLYVTLRKLGIKIFYDSEELSWGDNWKQVILDGVEESEFAIVVISKEFFGREWTERELNEFLQKQNENGQKIILPLLHEVSFGDLKKHYPELEYIHGISTDRKTDDVAILLAKELIKRFK